MAGYIIAMVEVTDWNQYREYMKATPAAVERYGGRFIIRGGEVATLEGAEEKRRVVVIEFPTLARAREFFHSPEYTQVKKLRVGAAVGQFIALEGSSIS